MSGGVDSSVAACLLREQGCDVVGVFMRLGADRYQTAAETCAAGTHEPQPAPVKMSLPLAPAQQKSRGCCSAADATDARQVAAQLNIPFYSLNFEEDFDRLVDYFVDEYASARTPNPCVRCNQWLKFGRLMEYADAIDADYVATGHYARIVRDGGRPRLFRARDSRKDQSYVLFGIGPEVLSRTWFPLGELTKTEVREHARRLGLELHDKAESQDICFVPDRDYARLVKSRRGDVFQPGPILHVEGHPIGTHDGIPHFTVGQRRGLRVAAGEPIYVSAIDAATNTVLAGPRRSVMRDELFARDVNWLSPAPAKPFRAHAKIRYQHEAAAATVTPHGTEAATIRFDQAQLAITPGQAVVLYEGDEVLGGGWIERVTGHAGDMPAAISAGLNPS